MAFILPAFDGPKNWVEDYEFENGQYFCTCKKCGERFMGHKRRVICKECAAKEAKAEK